MKAVLIITYYWPPASGAGVQRWLKLSKYLPQNGWQPIILTVKNATAAASDSSLDQEIQVETIVYRTRSIEPFVLYNWLRGKPSNQVEEGMGDVKGTQGILQKTANYVRSNFFIPDARMGWKPFAIRKGKEILKAHKVECIITTGPPHSTHLIGLELKRKLGIPWIVDLRDPWTTVFYNQILSRTSKAWAKDRQLEKTVLSEADHIIVVGDSMKKEFESFSDKISVIHNGFDEEDFEITKKLPSILPAGTFHLTYVGNFKYLQNHTPLWRAIKIFVDRSKDRSKYFRFNFVGNVHSSVKNSLESYGLSEVVQFLGYRPHEEAVQIMMSSTMLLFIISDTPGNQKLISGKIFEYLQSGRPIFSVGLEEGDADKILEKCGHMSMIPFGDQNQMLETLETAYITWKNNDCILPAIKSSGIAQYERSNQAKSLSSLLKTLTQ